MYQYQRFLFECHYSSIKLEEYRRPLPPNTLLFTYPRELFDEPEYRRMVPLSYLDFHIETKADIKNFITQIKDVNVLYIIDDRKAFISPLAQQFDEATKKAYLCITYFPVANA